MGNCKKILIVGDENIGKTLLLKTFADDYYNSTTFESYDGHILVDDTNIEITLHEAPSQEHYSQIRTLSYSETDAVIIAFSLVDHDSLENVEKKWLKEVKQYCPKVPIVLLGTKSDLRTDPEIIQELANIKKEPIKTEEGKAVAEKISAHTYMECSSKKKEGVWRVLAAATRATMKVRNTR